MAAPACLFYNADNSASLDLNTGTTYTVLPGVDMGSKVKTFSEWRGYDGTVKQYNISEANLIEAHVPILVKSNSVANLRTALAAINTKIGTIAAGVSHFTYNSIVYHLMSSPEIGWVEDGNFHVGFFTVVDLVLYRNTTVA